MTVEPDAALAAYLRTVMEGTTTRVVHSSFEESPLESAEFDLAVAAMSFHWVNTSIGLPKLRRVIRSRGWVALWWTLYGDPTRRDLFHDKTRALLGDPRDADVSSRPPFELDEDGWRYALEREGGFIDVDVERIHWTARFELPGLRAFYRTLIGVRRLAPDDQQALLNRLESVAADDFGGVVERPFVTAVYTARRP